MKESEFIEGQMRAARYAEVSDRTIRRWLKAGMQRTENGLYIKTELDRHKNRPGKKGEAGKGTQKEKSTTVRLSEKRQLCTEIDSAVGILKKIKARLMGLPEQAETER